MSAVHTDFDRAFRPGEAFESTHLGRITVRQVVAAELVLPSGHIVACEPSSLQGSADFPPFTRSVPPGRYPVVLSLARLTFPNHTEERVACALVRFSDEGPLAWEMALTPGQDPATLRPGQFFGYGVDGGRGGFLDAVVVTALEGERSLYLERLQAGTMLASIADIRNLHSPFFRRLWDARFAPGQHDFRPCVVLEACATTGANVVEFSSGWGDGCYASWWGLGSGGEPCCLVTDFGVLVEGIEGKSELPLSACLDGVHNHPDLKRLGIKVSVRIEEGPPLRVHVDYEGDEDLTPAIENGGKSLRYLGLSETEDGGSHLFESDGPLLPDARFLLTYSLGARAL
jgi:hypothetical protein